jgi:hypothetical protein
MAVDQQWLSEMMLMVLCKQDAMDGSSIAEAFSAVAALAQSETRRSVASLRWTEMMLTRWVGVERWQRGGPDNREAGGQAVVVQQSHMACKQQHAGEQSVDSRSSRDSGLETPASQTA